MHWMEFEDFGCTCFAHGKKKVFIQMARYFVILGSNTMTSLVQFAVSAMFNKALSPLRRFHFPVVLNSLEMFVLFSVFPTSFLRMTRLRTRSLALQCL
jgi:hypothetical protein